MKEDIDMLKSIASRITLGQRLDREDADSLLRIAERMGVNAERRNANTPPCKDESQILRRLHWFRYSWAASTMDQIIADAAIDEIRRMDRRLKEMEARERFNIEKELYDGQG